MVTTYETPVDQNNETEQDEGSLKEKEKMSGKMVIKDEMTASIKVKVVKDNKIIHLILKTVVGAFTFTR